MTSQRKLTSGWEANSSSSYLWGRFNWIINNTGWEPNARIQLGKQMRHRVAIFFWTSLLFCHLNTAYCVIYVCIFMYIYVYLCIFQVCQNPNLAGDDYRVMEFIMSKATKYMGIKKKKISKNRLLVTNANRSDGLTGISVHIKLYLNGEGH